MRHSDSIDALAKALADAQGELQPAKLDGENPHFHSKYATLSALWASVRPVFSKHGLAVIQGAADGAIETIITHASGQWIALDGLPMRPVKDDPQGIGSVLTYARRYGLASAAGLVADEDDDANAGSTPPAGKAIDQDGPKKGTNVPKAGTPDKTADDHKAEVAEGAPCDVTGEVETEPERAEVKGRNGSMYTTAKFTLVVPGHGSFYVTAWHEAAEFVLANVHVSDEIRAVGKWHWYKDTLSINAETVEVISSLPF